MDYQRQNHVDTRIIRIFNTYGPRMLENDGRVISNFIMQTLRGEELTIYGDGNQTRSFCYVDDLIEGMVRLMNVAEDSDSVTTVHDPVNVHSGWRPRSQRPRNPNPTLGPITVLMAVPSRSGQLPPLPIA